jgi:hypothetical protein
MERSLQVRKQKALARSRQRRRFAKGQLRLEQICLAATADPSMKESPLILSRVKISDEEAFGTPGE